MVGIIVSACLAALVLGGLIAFIYKTSSKASGNVNDGEAVAKKNECSKEKENTKGKIIGSVDKKVYEGNMKKYLGPEINSAIDYLAELIVFGSKEDMMVTVKNFKHINAKTQDDYLKNIDRVINTQKMFIDRGVGGTYSDIPKRLTNLNSLKQYLLNNK